MEMYRLSGGYGRGRGEPRENFNHHSNYQGGDNYHQFDYPRQDYRGRKRENLRNHRGGTRIGGEMGL